VMRFGELRTYRHRFKEQYPPFALKLRSVVGLDRGRSITFGDQSGECRRTLGPPTRQINIVQSRAFVGNQIPTTVSRGLDRREESVHVAHVIHSYVELSVRGVASESDPAAFRFDGRIKLHLWSGTNPNVCFHGRNISAGTVLVRRECKRSAGSYGPEPSVRITRGKCHSSSSEIMCTSKKHFVPSK
jgi:hypothetical protein